MLSKNELIINLGTTIKERIKFIVACLFLITATTGALIFFTNTGGAMIMPIIYGGDFFNYDWRVTFILLDFPAMVYFDILMFFVLFSPFTFRLAQLCYKLVNIIYGYIVFAFFIAIPLSLLTYFHIQNMNYYPCDKKGFFSSGYYVKEPKMCEQFEYHPEKDESDKTSILVTPADTKIK